MYHKEIMKETKTEYIDFISFYIYKLKQVNDYFEIDFIKTANIPNWLAKLTFIKNWSYEIIKHETEKAILFKGKNYKGEDKWIVKTQIEIGDIITEDNEHYLAHKKYIKDIELEENKKEL